MKLIPRIGFIAASTLAAAMLLGGCVDGVRATRADQQTVDHLAGTPIIIHSRNGSVQVVGDLNLTEVEISATINAGGLTRKAAEDRLAQTRLDVARDTTGVLRIAAVYPTPHQNRDGTNIIVRLPEASAVEVVTSNGSITAVDLAASLSATTRNGRITVRDWTGDAMLTTSNASVTVKNLAGTLTARTSNGRIVMDEQGGPVDAITSNGRIVLALRDDQVGPIDLTSRNASITVTVGPDFAGRMIAQTSNSSITIDDRAGIISSKDVDRQRADLLFTQDGPASRVRTSNGRITVRTNE